MRKIWYFYFGELFNHLSTHTCYSEIDFDLYLNKDFSKTIASKIPRENRKYQNTPGLSFPLDVLLERIPNIIIYWQVRHPSDAHLLSESRDFKNMGSSSSTSWLQRLDARKLIKKMCAPLELYQFHRVCIRQKNCSGYQI